ncbi:MAG: LLM class flavin-dependent oxidoreductase [bacterium]|nr:LLM class flavin-dependent oxidoreductase [bacterium]
MHLDLYIWSDSFEELGHVAAAAERAGFRTLWSAELDRSAFMPVAVMAGTTSEVRLGTGIALAFPRSPMVTALTALDLDEMCAGRLVLGLGSGVRRLNEAWHGVNWDRPVRMLDDTVRIVRALVAGAHEGRPIRHDGAVSIDLRGYRRAFEPRRTEIPVYLAAVGDQMTRLAGRTADGWLAHELGSPEYVRQRILPNIRTGLAKGNRERSRIDLVASACGMVLADGQKAMRNTAGLVAFYASVKTYTGFFAFHGFEDEALRVQAAFRRGDIRGMIEAVPDEMVDALTISGTPERAREKLAAYEGLVDTVKLSPPTHFVSKEVTRAAQQSLIDTFGG